MLTPAQIAAQEAKAAKEGYFHRVLVALDQFANVLMGGLPDETISSRMERWMVEHPRGVRHAIGTAMSKFLDLFQSDHGEKAEAGDLERANKDAADETKSLTE